MQNLFFSSLLLIGLFYLHMYVIYPVKDKQYGLWKYFGLIVLCLCIFSLIQLYLIPFAPALSDGRLPRVNRLRRPGPFFTVFSFGTVILGSYCYRLYLDKLKQAALIKELESIQLKTELDFLRSQISPHFMFNTMNTLVSMARKKSEQMETSLISLSQLMRYMLYDSEGSLISVEKEVNYLKNYINLQLLRFSNDLRFNLFLSGSFEGYKIEPMLLIPFVENAFKHGIGNIKDPLIDVILSMDTEKNIFSLMVMNNVSNRSKKNDKESGIGLANVTRRLELLYPDKHSLNLQQREDIFIVNLEINLK